MKRKYKAQIAALLGGYACSVAFHVMYPIPIVLSAWVLAEKKPKRKYTYLLYTTALVTTVGLGSSYPIVIWLSIYGVVKRSQQESDRLEKEFEAFRNRKLAFLHNPQREKRLNKMNVQLEERLTRQEKTPDKVVSKDVAVVKEA